MTALLQPAEPHTIPTKVALNALSATTGGGLSVARNLAAHLALARPTWQVALFVSNPDASPDPAPSNLTCQLETGSTSLLRRWRWEQLTYPEIESAEDFDVTLLLGGFTSFRARKPQLAIWQNAHLWSEGTPGHSLYLKLYIFAQRQLMRVSTRRATRNVFLSRDSIDQCAKVLNLSRQECRVIPIGPDDAFFRDRPRPGLVARSSTILAVGDVYPHKRFELAIDALSELRDSHPDLELKIAGRPIDRNYLDQLESRISQLDLDDRVHFLGGLPLEKLIEVYESSRLYVAASSLETFGLTPLEAMACGLPIVACRESATPEICGDAATYFESDSRSLAESIRSILENDQKWRELQRKGRERSVLFSWEQIGTRYAELIEEVVNNPYTERIG